jgi:CheY-like chemotaxis protein
MKILVVDDNVDMTTSTVALLGRLGYEARGVYDGLAAISACDEFRPDAILLDIGLPGLSGYEVCRYLRGLETFKDTCILAISGYSTDDDIEQSRKVGMTAHLVKPVPFATLRATLIRYLGS